MSERCLLYPPGIPNQYRSKKDLWVGSNDLFGPQLTLSSLDKSDGLPLVGQAGDTMELDVNFRTADMDSDDPDRSFTKGKFLVEYIEEHPDGGFNMLLNSAPEYQYGTYLLVWVWSYNPGEASACADFLAE